MGSQTGASSAPSPMRDSPNMSQLNRDFDGEIWDSLALDVYDFYDSGTLLHTSETYDLVIPFDSPVIHKSQIWCQCQASIDTTLGPQSVELAGSLNRRGEAPTSFYTFAIINLPLGGPFNLPMTGMYTLPAAAGAFEFNLRATAGGGVPDVVVAGFYVAIRRGRIPTP